MTPTARSKRYLEALGYRVAIVERWNPFAHIRQDLYQCIDLLAMKFGEPLLAVQVATTANVGKRIAKAGDTPGIWRSTGNLFEFHGWAKKGKRGKRKTWTLTVKG